MPLLHFIIAVEGEGDTPLTLSKLHPPALLATGEWRHFGFNEFADTW